MWTIIVALILTLSIMASAEPVDTRQYGFVKPGMGATEVQERLGRPDKIIPESTRLRPVHGPYGRELKEVVTEVWYYAGDGQVMHTYIKLENGVVIAKDKVQSGAPRW